MKTKIPYNQPPTHKRRVELLRSSKSMSMLLLLSILLIFSTTSYAQVAPVNPPSGGFNINGGLKANTSVGDWVKGTGTGGFVLNDDGSAPNTATTGLQRDAYNSGSDFIFTTEASLMILFQIFNGHNPLLQIKMISITPCIMSLRILP